ncbi:MAG: PASTA domain-containing protein [Synergistaceae bacterium]|jgi:serine/threonine-protein kinase|nr:PASTA domain-containing protein [Synergistaceae bacterium]
MNRIFRLGIMIALLVLVVSGFTAARIIFLDRNDVDVPDLVGLSAVEAANRLQGVGLVARIDQVESDQPEGIVISQVPQALDKIEKGKIVTMRASRGGSQTRIPDVRGLEFASAVKTLDESGFKIGTVIRVADSLKPSSTIIAQNPAAPAMVLNTKMIDLLVSEGQPGRTEMVQVPDLKGQTEALARQILEQSSLSVSRILTVESNQVPLGTVVYTQPRAGMRVPFGNAIAIYVAKAPEANLIPEMPTQVIQTREARPETPRETPASQQNTAPPQAPVRLAPVIPEWDPRAAPQGGAVVQQGSNPSPQVSVTPRVAATPAQNQASQVAAGGKTARIRYQVPPLSRSLSLRIEITDQSGTRVLRDQAANGGEYISMNAPYTGNATVNVRLGTELVWQEKYE